MACGGLEDINNYFEAVSLDQSVSILKYNLMDTRYRKSIHYTYFTHTLNGHKCGHSEYVTSMCKGYSSYTKYQSDYTSGY